MPRPGNPRIEQLARTHAGVGLGQGQGDGVELLTLGLVNDGSEVRIVRRQLAGAKDGAGRPSPPALAVGSRRGFDLFPDFFTQLSAR